MGIIGRQTIKGSIFSYLGVGFGFITVALIWPNILDPDEIGLLNVLVAISALISQFGILGFTNAITRYFPYYRNKTSAHHGFPVLIGVVFIIGSILSLALVFALKTVFLKKGTSQSELLSNFYIYVIPIIISSIAFELLDNYNKVLYDAVLGTFLKEFVFRILNLIITGILFFGIISFQLFTLLYIICLSVPSVILFITLIQRGELKLIKPDLTWVKIKPLIIISIFCLLGSFGSLAVVNIDKLMINKIINLSATGIYSTSFLFGTIIILPSRALGKISSALIGEAFKNNDFETIKNIYYKSCLNQLLFGSLVFLLIWLNLDDLYSFMPSEYSKGKYVVLFISIANLIDLTTGVNGIIISTSKYYYLQSIFVFILSGLVFITNLIFIPAMGINGAALATMLSLFIYNMIRYLFLRIKYGYQPFNYKFIIIILFSIFILFLFNFFKTIPMESAILRILVKGIVISILFVFPVIFLKISDELNIDNVRKFLVKNFFSKF